MVPNSALAAANFSGEKRRARECTYGPSVRIKCFTWCLAGVCAKVGDVIVGKIDNRCRKGSEGVIENMLGGCDSVVAGKETEGDFIAAVSISLSWLTSTIHAKWRRKSDPRRGCDTPAMQKFHV